MTQNDRAAKELQRWKLNYARKDFPQETNPLPPQYENQIICGDSLEVLKNFPDNCVDWVLTSPPYNFRMDYAKTTDEDERSAYFSKLYAVFESAFVSSNTVGG